MITEQRRQEISAAFQRSLKQDNKEETGQFKLSELRDADAMLGDRDINAGYRIALRHRISYLETQEINKAASRLRAMSYVMVIVTGLLVVGLAYLLFG